MREPVPSPRPRREPVPVPVEASQALQIVHHVTPYPLLPTTVLNAKGEEVDAPIVALALRTNVAIMNINETIMTKTATLYREHAKLRPQDINNWGAVVAQREAQFLEQERELQDRRDEERRLFEQTESGELVRLGRDTLRAEYWRVEHETTALATQERDARQRLDVLRENIAARVAANDDDPELPNARRLVETADRDHEAVAEKLREIQNNRTKLRRAWYRLRQSEHVRRRDAMSEEQWFEKYCPVCGTPTHEGLNYCDNDNACYRKRDAARYVGRRCACGRSFESKVRKVAVFEEPRYRAVAVEERIFGNQRFGVMEDIAELEPVMVDICSLECWQRAFVDEDEPPSFPPTVYLPPPPLTPAARARRSLQTMAAATAQAETTTAPPSARVEQARVVRAAQTVLDRYKSFLAEHPLSTDKEAEAAGFKVGTVKRLRHEHPDAFESDGTARGIRWSIR